MNLPTKITIVRIAMIPLVVISYCLQNTLDFMFIITASLFIIASMTDFVDGYIARKYNMVTSLGKFLDPIADKMLVVVGLLIIVNGNYIEIPYFAMICSIIILAREFIIGLFRQIAALNNYVLAADKLGKIKTISTMMALSSFLFKYFDGVAGRVFYYMGLVLFIIATVFTVVSGFNYLFKNRKIFAENKENKE